MVRLPGGRADGGDGAEALDEDGGASDQLP